MGSYLNTGFRAFEFSLNSEIYIDKSEIISLLNRFLNTRQRYICISRPRRFGKSFTAEMLSAYYSKGVDSSFLFDNLRISKSDSYKKHLNKYNTIFIDMQQFLTNADKDVSKMLSNLESEIKNELKTLYPEQDISEERKLNQILSDIYSKETEKLGKSNGFVFIIDEWDCIMREKQTDADGIKLYLDYLRALFKDRSYVSLAYMTGILPIKKYGTHSALNMFREFSMTEPGEYAPFVGFTEEDVKELCSQFKADFSSMKKWYDGYIFDNDLHLYNPNSVVESLLRKKFLSYWSQTETFESLSRYMDLNVEGLRDGIVSLIAGNEILVNSETFQNDMTTFNNRDDVFTLLIHLGYLAINPDSKIRAFDNDKSLLVVHIPNNEIRKEFNNIMKNWS
ncbi:Predicted AAA-ATPase [Succinivibrio dextrinosolvens DSM 3072]|uniref:Predicted AAA-ATPase n=1 Tax=Succinivibrio dextrinosolvens DSM 3072 TaxID=1123324 RepID=A0A1T4V9R1_9GAMM|nr:AAA family ATPase [Succinivibrio dextrinosolvens]SKA61657.1 Predicted AAA-ATPase [Succinivibrio dextrinosolvens DSM 3072]